MIGLDTLPLAASPSLSASDEKRLSGKSIPEVARQFEALLIQQMIQAMRRTIPDSGLFEASAERRVLDGAFDQELAQSLLARGGFGVARQLTAELEKRQGVSHSASAGAPATAPADRAAEAASGATLPVDGSITSSFGPRRDPISGEERFHAGIDLAAPRGAEVRAVAPGEVIFSGRSGQAGNLVEVRHPDASVSSYAHLDRTLVRAGDEVAAGEVLATVGSTGHSTGPHLHFALKREGHLVDPAMLLGENEA